MPYIHFTHKARDVGLLLAFFGGSPERSFHEISSIRRWSSRAERSLRSLYRDQQITYKFYFTRFALLKLWSRYALRCRFGLLDHRFPPLYNHELCLRLAISVPAAIPAPKPKANIPILTGDEILPHKVIDDETAITRKSNAVPINALFDFIFAPLIIHAYAWDIKLRRSNMVIQVLESCHPFGISLFAP